MYEELPYKTLNFSLVQLYVHAQPFIHICLYFICERKFCARMYVKIARKERGSTFQKLVVKRGLIVSYFLKH